MDEHSLGGPPVPFSVLPTEGVALDRLVQGVTAAAFIGGWIAALHLFLVGGGVADPIVVSSLAVLSCTTVGVLVFQYWFSRRRVARIELTDAGVETLSRTGQRWTLRWKDPQFHIWLNLGPGGNRASTPAVVWVRVRLMAATTIDLASSEALLARARAELLEVHELEFRRSLFEGKLKAIRISRPGLVNPSSAMP